MIGLTLRSGHRHVVRRSSRDGISTAALCLPLLIRPLARVAPLRGTAILRMCYPLANGLEAGGDFVLPPRPPPNDCLGASLRGADALSVLPPHPLRTRVVCIALYFVFQSSQRALRTALGLPGRWVLAACRRLRSRQLALGFAARGRPRPSLRPLGPNAWLRVANIVW